MANINAYIEQAMHNIETERDRQIAEVRATVMQEKVAPKNAELDNTRDKALQELQAKLNAETSALQERYASDRQAIIDATEKQKADNANTLINAETASIAYEFNTKIAELRKLIGA